MLRLSIRAHMFNSMGSGLCQVFIKTKDNLPTTYTPSNILNLALKKWVFTHNNTHQRSGGVWLGSLESCNLMKWWFEYVVNWALPNLYIGNGCDCQTSTVSILNCLAFGFSRMGKFLCPKIPRHCNLGSTFITDHAAHLKKTENYVHPRAMKSSPKMR